MPSIPAPLRRLLRPIAPWRLRDLRRRRQLMRQVGDNIDIVVSGGRRRRRWLATTPDTYRVGSRLGTGGRDGVAVGPATPELVSAAGDRNEVAVLAHAAPPPWHRRGAGAHIEPFALAATPGALADIGGDDDDPVPALFDRFLQAGHATTVVVTGRDPHGPLRLDPIPGPAAVVLSVTPLDDVGGGARSAQLTTELLARGYHVAHITRFATWSSEDLGIRHIHPRLEQYSFLDFDPATFAGRCGRDGNVVIAELPEKESLAFAMDLKASGFRFVYDLIDDWTDPSLGLDWYRPEIEVQAVADCDGLTASAPGLIEHIASLGREATLVPNGVNTRLFAGDAGSRPADLPQADTILGYHGSLYGDWLDWDAVGAVAESHPDAAVVMIGDPLGVPSMPANVHFLGIKPQFQLAPYAARYSVGLVPFALTETTHTVSPLKVFEYLAMGIPVAAPPLRAIDGVAGVYRDESLPVAVAAALAAPAPDPEEARRLHGWGERLERLLGSVGLELPDMVEPEPRAASRPATRYSAEERRLP